MVDCWDIVRRKNARENTGFGTIWSLEVFGGRGCEAFEYVGPRPETQV